MHFYSHHNDKTKTIIRCYSKCLVANEREKTKIKTSMMCIGSNVKYVHSCMKSGKNCLYVIP